mgnify:CR=1 FL=1
MAIVFKDHDNQTGITTIVHETETKVAIEKKYDAAPLLEVAKEMRATTDGQRWGEFRHVGFIPMAELGNMLRQDGRIDQKRAIEWLKANPALCTFEKLLK